MRAVIDSIGTAPFPASPDECFIQLPCWSPWTIDARFRGTSKRAAPGSSPLIIEHAAGPSGRYRAAHRLPIADGLEDC
jgi:hypothetical protein